MPVSPGAQAAQAFASYYGALVTGTAKTLPATGTGHLFTVSGGRVLLCSMTGTVSTVVQAQACTVSLGNTPSGGSAAVASIASASGSITGIPVGTSFGVAAFGSGGTAPASLAFTGASGVLGVANVGVSLDDGGICLVPAGTVDWTTSATNTGAVIWSVTYIPYDAGATITAL